MVFEWKQSVRSLNMLIGITVSVFQVSVPEYDYIEIFAYFSSYNLVVPTNL